MTLRNFGWMVVAIVIALALINVASELRAPRAGDYGRLFTKRVVDEDKNVHPAPAVVHEAEVPDQDRVDPMLIAPAARTEYLGTSPAATMPIAAPPAMATTSPARHTLADHSKIEIVGSGDGVRIEARTTAAAPKLSGGIFRPEGQD